MLKRKKMLIFRKMNAILVLQISKISDNNSSET